MTHPRRRQMLKVTGAAALWPVALDARDAPSDLSPDLVPPRPDTPTPGRPGDFEFLTGHWQIAHWRRAPGADTWDHFRGEATCWSLLGGIGSVEELRIPERGFSGMGLRLLDVKAQAWSDFWVNAKSGVLGVPGMPGSFEQGVGLFYSDYDEDGRAMTAASIWDRITPSSCRWRQAVTADGGRSWTHDWVMHWERR